MGTLTKIKNILEMVKFSHTIFALPFAMASLLIASRGLPSPKLLILILAAMVALRNAAMSFNRYLDADIDAKNPRTASRHIPSGLFSKKFVLGFSLINALFFIAISYWINPLCFKLSPFAVIVVFLYSFTKRFTHWSHLVLGLALGISPIGAWMAAVQEISLPPIVLSIIVLFWVAGFDIIYATQDYEFDRKTGLHSLVVKLGIAKALWLSRLFHFITLGLLLLFGIFLHFGWPYYLSFVVITGLFVYEHLLVRPQDLSRVNAAFFNVNGFISLVFLTGVILEVCP